jgi:hypothetical protein
MAARGSYQDRRTGVRLKLTKLWFLPTGARDAAEADRDRLAGDCRSARRRGSGDRSDGPGGWAISKETRRTDRDRRETTVLTGGPVRTGGDQRLDDGSRMNLLHVRF